MSMETKRPTAQNSAGDPPDRSEGYEHRDADTSVLLRYGLGLAIVIALVFFAMKGLFSYYAESQPLGPPVSPFETARVLPPQPRLQAKPRRDLRNYCGEQMQKLDSYAWLDPDGGVVRIPIDRAIDLTLQRGLPVRAATAGESGARPMDDAAKTQSSPNGPCAYWIGEQEFAKSHEAEK